MSDSYKNAQLLDLMASLLTTRVKPLPDAKFIRIQKEPEFSISFLNDKLLAVEEISRGKNMKIRDTEKGSLTDLITIVSRRDFIIAIEVTDAYEVYKIL